MVLEGRYCRLEPLDAARHGDQLYAASIAPGAEERFRYLFDVPMTRPLFDAWLARVTVLDDPLYFAVIDRHTGRCEGRQSLMRITPEHGVIEIGSILWGPAISRSRVATEALYLFASYAFDELGYRRNSVARALVTGEVRRAQCAVTPRGAALRLHVGRAVPPAHGGQGREPRHLLVLDDRPRVAADPGGVRGLARPRKLRRAGAAAAPSRGVPRS